MHILPSPQSNSVVALHPAAEFPRELFLILCQQELKSGSESSVPFRKVEEKNWYCVPRCLVHFYCIGQDFVDTQRHGLIHRERSERE